MGITDTLARDNGAIEIEVAGDWVLIGGINTWSPSVDVGKADTTKFQNQGRRSHLPASQGKTITLGGFRQVDQDTGARDPGQLACEQLSEQLGPDGLTRFRHSRPGGKVTVFSGSCVVTDGGGGNDDPDAWQVEIERSGMESTTTINAVPSVVTSVTGTPATDGAIISWTDGVEEGDRFEVVVYADGVPVKTVYSTDAPIFVALDADDYTARVRARNDAGWSNLSAASASFTVA